MSSLIRIHRPLNLLRPRAFATTSRLLASSNTSTSNNNSGKGGEGKAPEPKILSASPPKEEDLPEDVRQHNREMDQRADRPEEKVKSHEEIEKDKVPKNFWKGSGGVGD